MNRAKLLLGLAIADFIIVTLFFHPAIGYGQEAPAMPPPAPDMGGEMGDDAAMPPPPDMEDGPMDMPPEDAMEFDAQNQDQSSVSASNSNQSSNLSQVTIIRPETHRIQQNTNLDYSRFTTALGKELDKYQLALLSQATANLHLSDEETMIILPKIIAIIRYRISARQELQPVLANLRILINAKETNPDSLKLQVTQWKKKTAEINQKLQSLENELRTVLTYKQEAQLTLNGVITNGIGYSTRNDIIQVQALRTNPETKTKS
ncbi:MAG: hypothetical protein ACE14V_05020 [bacterium]